MTDPHDHASRRRTRRPARRVVAAARPLAVASAVALSSSGLGFAAVPAASAAKVQQRLVADGYLADADVSGVFDPRTGAAIARWQADRGLRAHGLVDEPTAERLLGFPRSPRSPS